MMKITTAGLVAVYIAIACTSGNPSTLEGELPSTGQASEHDGVDSTTECNDGFSGLSEAVHDAIGKTSILLLDYYYGLVNSGYDLAGRQLQSSVSHELTQVWNLIAVDSEKQPKRMLTRVGSSLQQLVDVHPGDTEALIVANSYVAVVYAELAGMFEKCVTTREVANRLRDHSLSFLQIAHDLRQGT